MPRCTSAWRSRASAPPRPRRRSSATFRPDRGTTIQSGSMALALPTQETVLRPGNLPRAQAEALYVHIPFCFHKCHYCDFYSITHQSPDRMDLFVDRMLLEAEQWDATPVTIKPQSVFFGGGTPTLLPIEAMSRLIAGLRARIDLSEVSE